MINGVMGYMSLNPSGIGGSRLFIIYFVLVVFLNFLYFFAVFVVLCWVFNAVGLGNLLH